MVARRGITSAQAKADQSDQIEAVQVHHLDPRGHKVLHKLPVAPGAAGRLAPAADRFTAAMAAGIEQ